MASVWLGVNEVVAALTEMNTRVEAATFKTVAEVSMELEQRAKANFVGSHARHEPHVQNGPPEKPNIVTGTLRRSINITPNVPAKIAGGFISTVGPTAEYGRRVELGFVGVDRLGRHYNQGPFSYFGPAVKEMRVRALQIALRNWMAATR